MKRLSLLGFLILALGFTGTGFAQTAAQYIGAGNQSYAAKDYVKGAQYYQAAVQLDGNSAAAFQGLGNCQYMLGKNAEALSAYEKASALDPNNAQLSSFVTTLKAKVGAASSVAVPTPGPAGSAVNAGSSSNEGKFELDVHAGVAVSSQTGFGGGLDGFVPLGKSFSLGAITGFYTFGSSASGYGASASSSINFLELMAAGKYRIDANGFHPYILGGVGMSLVMQTVSVTFLGTTTSVSASEMDPMISIGGGVEFPMGQGMNFFAQGRYSMVMQNGGSSTYEPIEAGLNFNL